MIQNNKLRACLLWHTHQRYIFTYQNLNSVEAVSPYSYYPPFDKPLFAFYYELWGSQCNLNALPFSKCKLLLSRHFFHHCGAPHTHIYSSSALLISLFIIFNSAVCRYNFYSFSFYRWVHGTLRRCYQITKKSNFYYDKKAITVEMLNSISWWS